MKLDEDKIVNELRMIRDAIYAIKPGVKISENKIVNPSEEFQKEARRQEELEVFRKQVNEMRKQTKYLFWAVVVAAIVGVVNIIVQIAI